MALDNLRLTRFRNHRESSLDATGGFNVLLGENGAGKTNVLEALSLLAPGRGLRRAPLRNMAEAGGEAGFAISAVLKQAPDTIAIGTGTTQAEARRRQVRINGAEATAASLAEWLSLVWLTPAMDRLWIEGASGRRRLLDRLVLALRPGHAVASSRYEQALRERNRLLSDPAAPDPTWLAGLERAMAEAGAELGGARRELVARLTSALEDLPDAPFAKPRIAYLPSGPEEAEALAAAIQANRSADRATGRSLVGPHRDDLVVTLAAKATPAAECSTGEQKAMLIAIVLAHATLLPPDRPCILLLDEIAAHLDPLRREALFERLAGGNRQVWMTGTEAAPFAALHGSARFYSVADGAVSG